MPDDDLFADLPDEVVEATAEIVPAKSRDAIVREQLQAIEDRILTEAGEQVLDGLHFNKLEANAEAPPESWIAELGEARAWERFRAAKYSLMPSSEAPVGVKNAVMIHSALTKARAQRETPNQTLNIGKVYLTVAAPTFPEKELDADE